MSDTIFDPGKHYRDLHFGMSRNEAELHVGRPTDVARMIDQPAIFPEDEAAAQDVVEYSYAGYPPYHATEVSLTFLKDRLVEISLTDAAEPIMLHGVDLFGKQRKVVSQTLFDLEPKPYGKRESGFFPSVGVVVPWPGYWREYGGSGYIELVEPTFLLERLDFYCFDPIDAPLP